MTGFPHAEYLEKGVKRLTTTVGFVLIFACQSIAGEYSAFARITVYWHCEGSGEHASWNGIRLHSGHCAVDPKKIPYASKVVFPDAACVAVDSGPHVVNRKAARLCGRNAAERNAIVIDRFFNTKQEALGWSKAHPHFMTVQILTTDVTQRKLAATEDAGPWPNIASDCRFDLGSAK
jgi:3D (Asp-Asp-Asp) domain-containing protein